MLGEAEFKDMADDMHDMWVTQLRENMNIPEDHQYVSTRFGVERFRKVVKIIGEENIIIATAKQIDDTVHMSAFISPEGIERTKNITA